MEQPSDRHSTIVGWAKIILPVIGIALFSSLFLLSDPQGKAGDIPFAELEQIALEQRISAPKFSGALKDGSILEITARSAKPQQSDFALLEVDHVGLTLDGALGSKVEVFAGKGEIDGNNQTARLTGLTQIDTSTGYKMETEGLIVDIKNGDLSSLGTLEARAPYGHLTAGQVDFRQDPATGKQQMVFTQGVRLIYTPTTDLTDEAFE